MEQSEGRRLISLALPYGARGLGEALHLKPQLLTDGSHFLALSFPFQQVLPCLICLQAQNGELATPLSAPGCCIIPSVFPIS